MKKYISFFSGSPYFLYSIRTYNYIKFCIQLVWFFKKLKITSNVRAGLTPIVKVLNRLLKISIYTFFFSLYTHTHAQNTHFYTHIQ